MFKRALIAVAVLTLLVISLFSCSYREEFGGIVDSSEREHFQLLPYWGEVPTTKSLAPLKEGIEIKLYCHRYLRDPLKWGWWPESPYSLVSRECGALQCLSREPILLPRGNYTFYAIAAVEEESSGTAKEIDNNRSEGGLYYPLKNGVKYLYAQNSRVEVEESRALSLHFSHLSSQLEIEFISNINDSTLELNQVTVTAPEESSQIDIIEGELVRAETLSDNELSLTIQQNRAKATLLPIVGSLTPKLRVVLSEKECGVEIVKEGVLPLPKEGWQSGRRYLYQVELSKSSITFIGATILEWRREQLSPLPLIEE